MFHTGRLRAREGLIGRLRAREGLIGRLGAREGLSGRSLLGILGSIP